jgi:dipeptidyl aminopeptidase/acylaminoacyl peptidase
MRMRILGTACGSLAFITASFLAGATHACGQSAPAKHPFSAKDWATLRGAGAAAVSTQRTILYSVSYASESGPSHREWWTIASDGTGAAKLTLPEGFSPNGFTRDGQSLYGSWQVNKHRQFAIFAVKDHKAAEAPTAVVILPRGVGSAAPSPDGKRFAIVADPRPIDPLASIRTVEEPEASSLYIVNADGTGGQWWCGSLTEVSGAVTVGGGANALAWNADSSALAVLSSSAKLTSHEVKSSIDLCTASGATHLTDIPNAINGIAWANGGKDIVFISTKTGTQTPEHIYTVPATGGAGQDLTPSLDGTAIQLTGDADGHVWVEVSHGVQNELAEFRDGALHSVTRWPDGVIGGVPARAEYPGSSSMAAFTVADPTHTGNVAVLDGDQAEGKHLRRITHEGDDAVAAIELGTVRAVKWKSKEGIALEGIATFPVGFVEGKKYPFLVLPHGGPEANDNLALDPFSRAIAAQGYVVIQPEYRGSTGYGEDFLAAIYQHFGDRAFRDVDSATDFAIAQGWADPNRLAIFGWSAGGFMTSWTVTQTNRYKAAIEGAGITDWSPFMWTSDVPQTDFDNRWTDESPEDFRKFSAVYFAKNVTTPLLILHGEADVRVPFFQGMEYFQVLAARGKTVRMVAYPGSGHFPSLWEQRINVFQEVTDWLAKYNK